jgi:cytochrome c oxidase cbb3-type subunit 3
MDYQGIFWMRCAATLILVIGIFVMAGSIKAILKSRDNNNRNQNQSKGSNTLKGLLVLIGTGLSGSLLAVTPDKATPIFEPSLMDVIGVVIVNVVLLFVFLYFKHIFESLAKDLLPEKAEKEKGAWFKLNKVLVDAVEIENEKDILMDHEYDGIRELDNNLPPWWKWGFYATIVFAITYLSVYHVFQVADLQIAEFDRSNVEAEIEIAAYKKAQNLNVDETTAILLTEASDIKEGKSLFTKNCVSCHGPDGAGGLGANLSDNYWLYGNDIKNVFSTIKYGANNGMRSWNDDFNGVQIQQIASFIITNIQGTNAPNGKEAEGEFYEVVAQ